MKRWMLLPLVVLMLWPASVAAQDEAQEEANSLTWWAVFTEHVSPANVEAYEAMAAEGHELMEANAPEGLVYYTLSGAETGYSFAIPMAGMADFMKLNEQWMGMINAIGWDTWEAMSSKSDVLVDHGSLNFYVEMPDQSYHPEGFAESMDSKLLRHYDWLYPKYGMEEEFNELMKEWVALYEENGLETGWTAYQAVSGDNLPMVVLITPAESAGAYYTMSEEIDEMLGEAGEEMMMKSLAMMRNFEHNEAWFRPELSIVPDEM